jgi:hypothetical protein
VELIFALISRLCEKPEPEVREAVEELDKLGLLGPKDLALLVGGGILDAERPHAQRILQSLSERSFSEQEAKRSLLAIGEAAASLGVHHEGKIQRYLRHYGQRMLDELAEHFTFSQMDKADVNEAFCYWLQNVLNMPVSLVSRNMAAFCERFKVSQDDLLQVADEVDINLALLDDLVDRYMVDQKHEAGTQ